MTFSISSAAETFGRCLVAMVTPMSPDGQINEPDLKKLTDHLIALGCDGLVVNGTTGESSTLSADESMRVLEVVAEHADHRAKIVAGIGSNDTQHSVVMAQRSLTAGADGLLLVSPYYNKPTQRGLIVHCQTIADSTDLPIMLYDIPGRTGIPYALDTILTLAQHPNIRAVKDAKGDLWAATQLMALTDLAWYSGADELNLPYLALGAVGVVSVVGHVAADRYVEMIKAVDAGDLPRAQAIHHSLISMTEALMNTSQGAIMAKAAMVELGVISSAHVRLPLVESLPEDLAKLRAAFATL